MSNLSAADMPGPLPEAKPIQLEQHHARIAVFAAWNDAKQEDFDKTGMCTSGGFVEAWKRYADTVTQLVALLGPNAQCYEVDGLLYDSFSDEFKEIVSCRPRGLSYTRSQVLDWLKRNDIELRFVV
jgi:hypothetical protein